MKIFPLPSPACTRPNGSVSPSATDLKSIRGKGEGVSLISQGGIEAAKTFCIVIRQTQTLKVLINLLMVSCMTNLFIIKD
jgi:hypothetical protein